MRRTRRCQIDMKPRALGELLGRVTSLLATWRGEALVLCVHLALYQMRASRRVPRQQQPTHTELNAGAARESVRSAENRPKIGGSIFTR